MLLTSSLVYHFEKYSQAEFSYWFLSNVKHIKGSLGAAEPE
jgi:hypothetical protein